MNRTSAKHSLRLHSSFAFYLLQSGFQVFKKRLRQELVSRRGRELEEFADDENLYPLYQRGESMEFVMERLCGNKPEEI